MKNCNLLLRFMKQEIINVAIIICTLDCYHLVLVTIKVQAILTMILDRIYFRSLQKYSFEYYYIQHNQHDSPFHQPLGWQVNCMLHLAEDGGHLSPTILLVSALYLQANWSQNLSADCRNIWMQMEPQFSFSVWYPEDKKYFSG